MWEACYDFNRGGVIGLAPVLGGILMIVFLVYGFRVTWQEKQKGEPSARGGLIFISFGIAFALVWTIGAGRELGSTFFEYRSALQNHRYQVIEGLVEQYDLHRVGRQGMEVFVVDDTLFTYSPIDLFGYRKTQRRGGPLENGKYVRIHYYDGHILRLWIRK